jgi:ABC-type sugar transport system permease subunit
MLVQNPIGVMLAAMLSLPKLRFAAFYRTAIFLPTLLSFVIVGFIWKLILSPIWGVAPDLMDLVGLKSLFTPWLGKAAIRRCHRVADLGLAVRRHPDDADLCRAPPSPTR